ncbi:FAD synthetase family protein [Alteribacillus bidgolensis]|uniref:Riboflavin biosynthesis protein n=1 Tax=Alteribacillus bidgolensis TaxID=930129 RepID=A0A1G8QUT1_9BACI|nr:FAD synthetase family protein [Alteribacillus bidgolensis]SDJ07930.1 riboflavin kinase / FMN adenylyltransferase [Alteribacillus bidgolensis]
MEVVYLNCPSEGSISNVESHVMAIGFFDGIHLGHQYLLEHAKRLAKQQNKKFTAMTFFPHPNEVVKGEKNRKYLTPWSLKVKKMASIGCEKLFVVNFDKPFAALSPYQFINQYILNLQAAHVVVGFDFTFGFMAKGDTDYLQKEGLKNGFGVTVISKKTYNAAKISSTLIRNLVTNGEVHLIPYYLGTHYETAGNIYSVRTNRFGTKSMKIAIDQKYLLPKPGLYQIEIQDDQGEYPGNLRCLENGKTEIVLKREKPIGSRLTVKFLNKVSTVRMASV